MQKIGVEVDKIVSQIFAKKHPILGPIINNWGKFVGPQFSTTTCPFKISSSYEKSTKINVLYIYADNASVGLSLSFQQDLVIERMGLYFGEKPVSKFKIISR